MRIIIETDDLDDLILAARAAKWINNQPQSQKDAILSYGESTIGDFYVRRTKTGISVRRLPRHP